MSQINQARELLSVAQDATQPKMTREQAWTKVQEIKAKAKMSYAKLGLTDEDRKAMLASIEAAPDVVAEAPVKKDRKVASIRAAALQILGEMSGAARKDRIEALMVNLSITKFNAAYYVDRVAK